MLDACLLLSNNGTIVAIQWQNPLLEKSHAAEWNLYRGRNIHEIPDIHFNPTADELIWRGDRFTALEFSPAPAIRCLLVKREEVREELFAATLNSLQDGVQIYNANAELSYINAASRRISDIPAHIRVEGRHLMDLYDLEEEVSTTMTCLRTQRPVVNRFDSFTKSTDGKTIVSINTAYPIFDDQKLIGAVVFERDMSSINDQIHTLEEMRENFERPRLPVTKFTGYHFSDLIGDNPDFQVAVNLARKIAPQDCNVLLVGETGTGKEIFAQSIHKASGRKHKKFVAINCAAVPETLIESMFFGTRRGSFTGSVDKAGLLEEAQGGTLFLDELNSMSLSMQSKLLRVIQENSFRRVGSSQDIASDVRFISSCNEAPEQLIEKNILRKDLFYRLSTVTIDIPPLRARADDIMRLTRSYLAKSIARYAKSAPTLDAEVIKVFEKYPWPGNVRELFNVLDYVLNTLDGEVILPQHLPKTFTASKKMEAIHRATPDNAPEVALEDKGLAETLQDMERKLIEEALIQTRYKIGKAAARLKLSRQNLQYRIKKLGLET